MTLIGYTLNEDHAVIVTDSGSYTGGNGVLEQTTKVLPLVHIDTVITFTGDGSLGRRAQAFALEAGRHCRSIDVLVGLMEPWFEEATKSHPAEAEPVCVYLIGWSEIYEEFVAYALHTAIDGGQLLDLADAGITPAPNHVRPGPDEDSTLDYLISTGTQSQEDVAAYRAQPALTAPTTDDEWRELVWSAYRDRAQVRTDTGRKVGVHGKVVRTRLERGRVETVVIDELPTSGPDFDLFVAGTLHPRGQALPCPCGSSTAFRDCCLVPHLAELCSCGSGATHAECCVVNDDGVPARRRRG